MHFIINYISRGMILLYSGACILSLILTPIARSFPASANGTEKLSFPCR